MVSHYVQVNVSLSNQQLNKIKNAARNGTGVSIRIGRNMLNKSGNMMYLTKTQLEKINRSKNPVTINFSASQLKFWFPVEQLAMLRSILLAKVLIDLLAQELKAR